MSTYSLISGLYLDILVRPLYPLIRYQHSMLSATLPLGYPQNPVIARQRLSRSVADKIVELIRLEGLKRGERLPSEMELAIRFNLSRAVLREALVALETEGQLMSKRGVGRLVATTVPMGAESERERLWHPTRTPPREVPSLISVAEARVVVEPKVAFLAAFGVSDDALNRLEMALMAMSCFQTDDLCFIESDQLFHLALSECSGNRSLVHVVATLGTLWKDATSARSRKCIVNTEEMFQETIDEHNAILGAIHRRQPIAARKCMLQHLKNEKNRFNAAIKRHGTV